MSDAATNENRDGTASLASGRSAAGGIAADLRARILAGEIEVGAPLPPERDLAVASGVSRGSVRQALQELAQEGLVAAKVGRNGGYFVQQPPSDAVVRTLDVFIRGRRVDQQSLLEMREILEPQCAALAAHRGSADMIEGLHALTKSMRDDVEDVPAFLDRNVEWHVAIAEASMNPVLTSVMQAISQNIRTAIDIEDFASPTMMRAAQRRHEQVVAAIRKNDVAAAYRWMRKHLDETYDVVREGDREASPVLDDGPFPVG